MLELLAFLGFVGVAVLVGDNALHYASLADEERRRRREEGEASARRRALEEVRARLLAMDRQNRLSPLSPPQLEQYEDLLLQERQLESVELDR